MEKKTFVKAALIAAFAISSMLFNACTEDPTTGTRLSVKVVNSNNDPQSGYDVKLFNSYTDCANNESVVEQKTTDSDGTVVFGDLAADNYYNVRAVDGNYSSACYDEITIEDDVVEITITVNN